MTIIALAGRRIDAVGADPPRFPLGAVDEVRQRVHALLQRSAATWLVSSAACGADLVAHEAARMLNVQQRIVLPFARDEFRRRSVADRPGNWESIFDRLVDELQASANVVQLDLPVDACDTFARTNEIILDEAVRLMTSSTSPALAAVVWEGHSRGLGDTTAAFADAARARGVQVTEVLTT
jgi:hypothetical protein